MSHDSDPVGATDDLRATPADRLDTAHGTARRAIDVGLDDVIEIVEEQAIISAERVQTGTVRVRTVTEEADVPHTAQLATETVSVERVPVRQFVDAMPQQRVEGDVTIIPVVEERVVMQTRLFVTEEIRIRRDRRVDDVEVPVSLRRQRAVIERLGPDGTVVGDALTRGDGNGL